MKHFIYKLKDKFPHLNKYVVHNIASNSTKTKYCPEFNPNNKHFTTAKNETGVKTATAQATVHINNELTNLIKYKSLKNGDVLSTAQVAGFMGTKKTSDILPLRPNTPLSGIDVRVELNEKNFQILITATVNSNGETGVEIEAITGVSVAALTVYDMCKGVSQDIVISDIHLVHNANTKNGESSVKNYDIKPIKTTENVNVGFI